MKFLSKNALFLYYVVFTANILSFLGGMLVTWSSPVIPKLNNQTRLDENPLGRVITENEASWIGSLINLGAMIIPFFIGYSADKFGRKWTLIGNAVPYVISSLILAFAKNIWLYYFARILGGAALGATFTIVPVYISEIAEKQIRGILGALMNTFVTLGILASFAIGPYVSVMWLSLICAILPVIFLVLSFFIPESPYYLIKCENNDKAIEIMKQTWLTIDLQEIDNELKEMKNYIELGSSGKITDLFTMSVPIKGMIITCMLMVIQQVCGVNAISFYVESLFAESGGNIAPEISAIIFGAAQASATFITPLFIDSFGRKKLLNISAIGMFIPEYALATYFYLKENNKDTSALTWMPVLCLTLFIFTHNLGYAPIPWVIVSEIFPESVRYYGVTSVTCFSWFMSFLMTLIFAPLSNAIQMNGVFFLFGSINIIAILFVIFYVPETKGKNFQEIQIMLQKGASK